MARRVAHLNDSRWLYRGSVAGRKKVFELSAGCAPEVKFPIVEVEVVLEELRGVLGVAPGGLQFFAKVRVVTVDAHVDACDNSPISAKDAVPTPVMVVPEHHHLLHGIVALVTVDAENGRGPESDDPTKVVFQAERGVRRLSVAENVCGGGEHVVHVGRQHHAVPPVLLLDAAVKDAVSRRLNDRPPYAFDARGAALGCLGRVQAMDHRLKELVEARPRGPVRRRKLAIL